jgi:hypothetical protein
MTLPRAGLRLGITAWWQVLVVAAVGAWCGAVAVAATTGQGRRVERTGPMFTFTDGTLLRAESGAIFFPRGSEVEKRLLAACKPDDLCAVVARVDAKGHALQLLGARRVGSAILVGARIMRITGMVRGQKYGSNVSGDHGFVNFPGDEKAEESLYTVCEPNELCAIEVLVATDDVAIELLRAQRVNNGVPVGDRFVRLTGEFEEHKGGANLLAAFETLRFASEPDTFKLLRAACKPGALCTVEAIVGVDGSAVRLLGAQAWKPRAAGALAPALEPSFACREGLSPVERMVCADLRLAELDRQLAGVFARRLATATDPDAFKREQRLWLATVRDACGAPPCVAQAYRARLELLAQ